MTTLREGGPESFSGVAIRECGGGLRYPRSIPYQNPDVTEMTLLAPGIAYVETKHASRNEPILVVSGGIHGDERAGIVVLDNLFEDITMGRLPVKRNLLLVLGNLRAMEKNVRCFDEHVGPIANLNRCFGHGRFQQLRCYAEYRANEMMACAAEVLTDRRIEAIDIHQSFGVPTLADVREGCDDRSEYTYAIAYPNGSAEPQTTLQWFYEHYSDIVAGVVLNDMQRPHHTWAGYLAAEYGAAAATFEQGTTGRVDAVTFTPQLYDNLRRSIRGDGPLAKPEGFDVWRLVRGIERRSKNFTFLRSDGSPLTHPPRDFTPVGYRSIAHDDGDGFHHLESDQRLLFANANVPLGDRAAAVVERVETDIVPRL